MDGRMASAEDIFSRRREPDKQLRIGYVSPDLGDHSVAYFVTAVFPNHDRSKFKVFCYSDRGEGR